MGASSSNNLFLHSRPNDATVIVVVVPLLGNVEANDNDDDDDDDDDVNQEECSCLTRGNRTTIVYVKPNKNMRV